MGAAALSRERLRPQHSPSLPLPSQSGWPPGNFAFEARVDATPGGSGGGEGIAASSLGSLGVTLLPHRLETAGGPSGARAAIDQAASQTHRRSWENVLLPEFAQGSAFASSVAESLLAASLFEPHVVPVIKQLVSSSTTLLTMVQVPLHLLVRRRPRRAPVPQPAGTAASAAMEAHIAALNAPVAVAYCDYSEIYAYCMRVMGLTPLGIVRHGARVRGSFPRLAHAAVASATKARAAGGVKPDGAGVVEAPVPQGQATIMRTLAAYYQHRLPQDMGADGGATAGAGAGRDDSSSSGDDDDDDGDDDDGDDDDGASDDGGGQSGDAVRRGNGAEAGTAPTLQSQHGHITNRGHPLPPLLPQSYVVTAPDGDTKVKADDLIVAIVSLHSLEYAAARILQRWLRSWRMSGGTAAPA